MQIRKDAETLAHRRIHRAYVFTLFRHLSLFSSTERRQAQGGILTCSRPHKQTLAKPLAGRFLACPFSHVLRLMFGPGLGLARLWIGESVCHSLVSRARWSKLYCGRDKVSSREIVTSGDPGRWRCRRKVQPTCRLPHEGLAEATVGPASECPPSSGRPGHPSSLSTAAGQWKQPQIDSWGQIHKGNG